MCVNITPRKILITQMESKLQQHIIPMTKSLRVRAELRLTKYCPILSNLTFSELQQIEYFFLFKRGAIHFNEFMLHILNWTI